MQRLPWRVCADAWRGVFLCVGSTSERAESDRIEVQGTDRDVAMDSGNFVTSLKNIQSSPDVIIGSLTSLEQM